MHTKSRTPIRVLMLTDRGRKHQRHAAKAAPSVLELTMLRRPAPEHLRAALAETEIIISERNQAVTAEMIAAASRLRYILRLGSLVHDIDLAAARRAGVRVSAQPVRDSILAAEHVFMMSLALLKRLGRSLRAIVEFTPRAPVKKTNEDTFAYNWMGYRDLQPLQGQKVAILGMGEIGVELVRRMTPFHPGALWYHKRSPYPPAVEQALKLERASFKQCVRDADVLVSLLPFTAETAHCFGQTAFDMMPSHAVLVHAGSGGVIDEAALARALLDGRIAGAALDTFEFEPLPSGHPLVNLARDGQVNLLLTPHVASGSLLDSRAEDFAEVLRFLRGEPLHFEVTT